MSSERSIRLAYDKVSDSMLDANLIFKTAKQGFEIRRQSNHNEIILECCQCFQKLNVSSSKNDRIHFKHEPNSGFCVLKDDGLSNAEIEEYNNAIIAKESPRHIELKNKIGSLIKVTQGFDLATLAIDNKFIFYSKEKRRHDVYCEYQGKKVAFEIQLSKLSQRYILDRRDFYFKSGIYLIWILDDYSVYNQSTFERDIKYLTPFQNFFKLDETCKDFRLICNYKFPFLTDDNKVLSKWIERTVKFEDIKFDSESYQVYFFNYLYCFEQVIIEQERISNQLIEKEKEKKRERALGKAKDIIAIISDCKSKELPFYTPSKLIEALDESELLILNETLQFSTTKKHALHKYISSALKKDILFIRFLLECYKIEINIDALDDNGLTLFQQIYVSQSFDLDTKYFLVLNLFYRGYELRKSDIDLLSTLYTNSVELEKTTTLFELYQNLNPRHLIHQADQIKQILLIIESAFANRIIGYHISGWIAFANNAIFHHSAYWEYIESAFRKSGLFEELLKLDIKHSFRNKLQKFNENPTDQDDSFSDVIQCLYPELWF